VKIARLIARLILTPLALAMALMLLISAPVLVPLVLLIMLATGEQAQMKDFVRFYFTEAIWYLLQDIWGQ
jgi:hypothetical protein